MGSKDNFINDQAANGTRTRCARKREHPTLWRIGASAGPVAALVNDEVRVKGI